MAYTRYRSKQEGEKNSYIVGFESITQQFIEQDNVHFIISRYSGKDVEQLTKDRYISITFGNVSEREIVEAQGAEANGLRHFAEHIIGRLVKNYIAQVAESIPVSNCFKWLHEHGISLNAETTLHSLKVIASFPFDEDFGLALKAANKLLSGSIAENKTLIQSTMNQEHHRITNEILIFKAKARISDFIAKYIYTPNSYYNTPTIIGTDTNLSNVTVDTISKMISNFTTNAPVTVLIHNPPPELSNQELVNQILIDLQTTRKSLRPEAEIQKNEFNFHHGWVHLENEYIPNDGKVETTVVIPIPELNERDIATWTILADILVTGLTSPRAEFFHYNSRSKLYATSLALNRSSSAIEIDANIDAQGLLNFVQDALEFFALPEHRDYINSYNSKCKSIFEVFKNRRINKEINDQQDVDEKIALHLYKGRYVPPSEFINLLEQVTKEDVLELLDRIQQNLSNANLITLTGANQDDVTNAILAQLGNIDELIPLQQIVQQLNNVQEPNVLNRDQIFSN